MAMIPANHPDHIGCKHRRYRALCQSHIDVNCSYLYEHRMLPITDPDTRCEWCKDDDVRGDGLAVAIVDLQVWPKEA